MPAKMAEEKDELCRQTSACSAGSQATERSFLSSTPTPDATCSSPSATKSAAAENLHATATPSTSTDSTTPLFRNENTDHEQPCGKYKRSKSLADPVTRTNSLLSSGDEDDHFLSKSRRSRARSFDYRSARRPRREQRSMSVVVGLNGQVWTQPGSAKPDEGQHANNVAVDEEAVETMAQNYYPEGGWGWGVCVCAAWVHLLLVGGHIGGVGAVGFASMHLFQTDSAFTPGRCTYLKRSIEMLFYL